MGTQHADDGWHHMSATILNTLANTDVMSNELRHCVHDFGYPVVKAFMKAGISDAGTIRALVYAVWRGPAAAGQGKALWQSVDYALSNQILDHKGLARLLAQSQFAIVGFEPTKEMIAASMREVSGGNVIVSKEEKHRRRLRAALKAASCRFERYAFSDETGAA